MGVNRVNGNHTTSDNDPNAYPNTNTDAVPYSKTDADANPDLYSNQSSYLMVGYWWAIWSFYVLAGNFSLGELGVGDLDR